MNEEPCIVCKGTGMRESWNSFTGKRYPYPLDKERCWCKNIPTRDFTLDEPIDIPISGSKGSIV